MKIIGGEFRGMNLFTPKDQSIRPTTGRIREDMFNIIRPYLYNANFLDLFSGTGAVGLEALSRGAGHVDFVERANTSISLLRKNIEKTKTTDKTRVIRSDARKFLLTTDEIYDIIFFDPPYKYDKFDDLFSIIIQRNLVKDDGLIIAEHDKHYIPKEKMGKWDLFRVKNYSVTQMHYYKKTENSIE